VVHLIDTVHFPAMMIPA